MSFQIDHREVTNWADRVKASPKKLGDEMARATNAVAGRGVEYAIEYAPRNEGNLAGSIGITRIAGSSSWHAAYGTRGTEYAWQREMGGVIRARNKPYLVFQINGRWVKVKSVRQKGSFYMKRARERIRPEATIAWQMAIERSLEGV